MTMARHGRFMTKLVVILSFLFSACAARHEAPPRVVRTYPIDSLNALLMANIKAKKVVLIADARHGDSYFMGKVTSFLRRWVGEAALPRADSRTPSSLILFLEIPQEFAQYINDYVTSGNLDSLFAKELDSCIEAGSEVKLTVDYFRFYHELRDICLEIDRLNHDRPRDKLELRIVGAENAPPLKYADKLAMPPDKFEMMTFLWFARERDRQSSLRIKTTLDQNPRSKGLVFYGQAHLARDKQDKSGVGRMAGLDSLPPLHEYYLAHHLDSLFGRKQVSVFIYGPPDEIGAGRRGNLVERLQLQKEAPDYRVRMIPPQLSPCPVLYLRNKATLAALLQGLRDYGRRQGQENQSLALAYGRLLHSQLLRTYLYVEPAHKAELDSMSNVLTRGDATSIPEAARIADGLVKSFDAVENIEQMDTWLTRKDLPDSSQYVPMVRGILRGLLATTGSGRAMGQNLAPPQLSKYTLSSAEEQALVTREKTLIQYSLITLLWLATPEEKDKAVRFLQKSTGLNFATASDWSTWWDAKANSD